MNTWDFPEREKFLTEEKGIIMEWMSVKVKTTVLEREREKKKCLLRVAPDTDTSLTYGHHCHQYDVVFLFFFLHNIPSFSQII